MIFVFLTPQLETEVAEAQAQIQACGAEMAGLRREVKTSSLEANELRCGIVKQRDIFKSQLMERL